MKHFALIAGLLLAMGLMACGDDESSGKSEPSSEPELAKPETSSKPELTKPVIDPPPGALPKSLVIKEIEEGEGAEAEVGDEMTVEYYAVDPSGKERYSSWNRGGEALTFTLGAGEYFEGWDRGLAGMKVGERREVFFPAKLAFGLGPLFYVIDLLRIE